MFFFFYLFWPVILFAMFFGVATTLRVLFITVAFNICMMIGQAIGITSAIMFEPDYLRTAMSTYTYSPNVNPATIQDVSGIFLIPFRAYFELFRIWFHLSFVSTCVPIWVGNAATLIAFISCATIFKFVNLLFSGRQPRDYTPFPNGGFQAELAAQIKRESDAGKAKRKALGLSW